MWVQKDDLRPNVPHAQLTVFGQVSNIVVVPQSISRPTTYTATVAGFSRFSRDLRAYEVLWQLHTNVDIEYDDDGVCMAEQMPHVHEVLVRMGEVIQALTTIAT